MNNDEIKKIIESIIFVSQKPVTIKELKVYFKDYESRELRNFVKELIGKWNELDSSFSLVEVSEGYQFRTKSEYSEDIINFNKEVKIFRLSKAALEVLAITAYKQPLTRIEIDQIRGVDSSGVINLLLDKRLLEIRGRKDVPGRPFLYGTSDEFLETFSLRNLKDLPTLKEIEEIDEDLNLDSQVFNETQ